MQSLSPDLLRVARVAACEFFDGKISSADAAARFARVAQSGWHGEPLNDLHAEFDRAVTRLIDSAATTRRAETIREETGLSWETSCQLAELERDGGDMPRRLLETMRAHNARQDSLGSCYVPPVNVRIAL